MRESLNKSVPILAFHKVDPSFEWGVTRVTPQKFQTVLEFLKQHQYSTISLWSLCHSASELPSKPIVLTFDDSYESVYTNAFPILREYGFTGTVFIITGFVGKKNTWDVNLGGCRFRHLSWSQIRGLHEAGFEIGSHTVHHPDLTKINDPDWLNLELKRSKHDIEDNIGNEVRFISFPFGRYNKNIIETCKSAGYTHGCSFILSKKMKKSQEKFVLERKPYYLFDRERSLKAKLKMNAWTAAENAKLRMINLCSHASSLVKPTIRPRNINVSKNTFT